MSSRLREMLEKHFIRCCLLAFAGFVVHLPALHGELLWDDDYLIRTNPFIRSPLLILEVFRHYLFPGSSATYYRPVQNLSYMADYFLWNNNPYGFHLASVLWHVAAGLVLYALLARILPPLLPGGSSAEPVKDQRKLGAWLAFLVSLLWIVHPVHSAAVDYISGRADSLAVFFGAAAWVIATFAQERRGTLRFILFGSAWMVALLALCARESGCLWPVLFLINSFCFQRSTWLQKAITFGACLLLFMTFAGLRQLPTERPTANPSVETPGPMRGVLMLRALGDYGRLMIFPSNLHMERTVYSRAAERNAATHGGADEFEYLSLGGVLVVVTLVGLASRGGQGQRLRILGALWFISTYLPISNMVHLNATVAEHWLYLPSIGFIIFAVGCGIDLPLGWRRGAVTACVVAIFALAIRSSYRSADWASNEAFARSTIRSGGLTNRTALLLGQVYSNRGDYVHAEQILRKAVEMFPGYPMASNNLAQILVHLGRNEEARVLLTKSADTAHAGTKEDPRTWYAALRLSRLSSAEGKISQAIQVLENARRDYPDVWELISAESELLRANEDDNRARELVGDFTQQHWWHYGAHLALGRLLLFHNDEAAASEMSWASRLDVHETAALNQLTLLRVRQNRLRDALQVQSRAVSREPDQPRQYLLLSDVLDKMGRGDEARAALTQIDHLRSLVKAD
jgi:Flp pilus assembly protein TadD